MLEKETTAHLRDKKLSEPSLVLNGTEELMAIHYGNSLGKGPAGHRAQHRPPDVINLFIDASQNNIPGH